jgi:tetratricopeptide (TPR) repeat protein
MTRIAALRSLLSVLCLAGAGCAYYNGLYNAKDLARRAERASERGREFEARSLWGQVAVKAETVLVRFPRSKHADEARFLLGRSLERTGECRRAVPPLVEVVRDAKDPVRTDAAAMLLSTCLTQAGDIEGAGLAVERLLQSADPDRRAEAEWRTGVAYRRRGRSVEAVELLRRSTHPNARRELAAALADAGRIDAAIALSDSLIAERDALAPWGTVFAGIARHAPDQVAPLLERVIAGTALTPDSAATWLKEDGERALPGDTARAMAQLEAAHAAAPGRPVAIEAQLRVLELRLAVAADDQLLDSLPLLLEDAPPSSSRAFVKSRQLLSNAVRLGVMYDSVRLSAPQGDLRAFVLGELMRDSLGAHRLATNLWRGIIDSLPASPYAPKALFALTALERGGTDLEMVAARYPTSPYVVALRGGDDPAFRILEDSLARFARVYRALPRAAARPPQRPATTPQTDLP